MPDEHFDSPESEEAVNVDDVGEGFEASRGGVLQRGDDRVDIRPVRCPPSLLFFSKVPRHSGRKSLTVPS